MANLKQNVVANYAGQGWRALAGILFIPLYIDILGMESYALVGIFGMLGAWLSLLDVGMSPTLNREMARFHAGAHTPQSIHNLLHSLELVCGGVAFLAGLLVWFGAGYLATRWLKVEKLPVPVVVQALSIISLVLSLRFLEGLYRSALYGLQQQVWFNAASVVLETLRHGGVVLVLLWISPSIQAFFVWQLALSFLSLFLFRLRVHQQLPKPPSRACFSVEELRQVWKFAGGMLAISLLSVALVHTDKAILSYLLPLQDFGYYSLATTVTNVMYMASGPVGLAVYPRMVELQTQRDEEGLISLYHKAAQITSVLLIPCALLLYFFGDGIVYMWSGKIFLAQQSYPLISALALGTLFNNVMGTPYHCMLAHGWTSLNIKLNIAAVCLLVPLMFWIVPWYGALGAAWIWACLNLGYITFGIYLMHRKILLGEKWRWYIFDLFLPLLGALLVAPIAWWARPIGYTSRVHWFFFLFSVGICFVFACVFFSKHLRSELFVLVRFFLKKDLYGKTDEKR